jgi:hypothetical protein
MQIETWFIGSVPTYIINETKQKGGEGGRFGIRKRRRGKKRREE